MNKPLSRDIAVVTAAVLTAVLGSCVLGTRWGGPGVGQIVWMVVLSVVPMLTVALGGRAVPKLGWTLAAWAVVFLAQVIGALGISEAILAERGQRVTATVSQDRGLDGKDGGEHLYGLSDAQGKPLGGVLRTPNEHRVGDTVSVLVDPGELAHPREKTESGIAVFAIVQLIFAAPGIALYVVARRRTRADYFKRE